MDILYLSIVFLVIVVIIWLKKPLFVAMIGGIAATIILFRVNLKDAAVVLGRPVSYTHLDVYKRQVCAPGVPGPGLRHRLFEPAGSHCRGTGVRTPGVVVPGLE